MIKASLALALLLSIPATAVAQMEAPSPAAAPPGSAPPPGYAPAPGYPPGYPPAPGYAPPPGYAPYGYPPPAYPPAGPGSVQADALAPHLQGLVLSFALGYASGWGDADQDNYGNGE